MSPLVSTTTPLPNSPSAAPRPPAKGVAPLAGAGLPLGEAPLAGDGLLVATWVTIRTSEGWTALYARSERGGAGVIEASAREMPEATSCWVRARGPGTNSP